jgi:hypothetical protein
MLCYTSILYLPVICIQKRQQLWHFTTRCATMLGDQRQEPGRSICLLCFTSSYSLAGEFSECGSRRRTARRTGRFAPAPSTLAITAPDPTTATSSSTVLSAPWTRAVFAPVLLAPAFPSRDPVFFHRLIVSSISTPGCCQCLAPSHQPFRTPGWQYRSVAAQPNRSCIFWQKK